MKKLNLKMKGIGDMLSKKQMKNVVGGSYGTCSETYWVCNCVDQYFYECSAFDPSGYGACGVFGQVSAPYEFDM